MTLVLAASPLLPSPLPTSPPLSDSIATRLQALAVAPGGTPTHSRLLPLDVLSGGRLVHDSYVRFMTGQLHAAIEPSLRSSLCCRPLLDRLATAGDRAARAMAELESGRRHVRWLPGARGAHDAYRREPTAGHYMTVIADELGSLSHLAASAASSAGRQRGAESKAQSQAERRLLTDVAALLLEFKRAVRSAAITHVNDDHCRESARRFGAADRHGRAQPGQEMSHVRGATVRVGGGVDLTDGLAATLGGGCRAARTVRTNIDLDRDGNVFDERTFTSELRLALKPAIASVDVGVECGFTRGRYFEGATMFDALRVARLHESREGRQWRVVGSAGRTQRRIDEVLHGLGAAVRKLVGGGADLPHDAIGHVTRAKEEKGNHNRALLQSLAERIDDDAAELARLKGRDIVAPGALGQAARAFFPTMAEQIASYRERSGIETEAEPRDPASAIGMAREPLSVPAMLPLRGKPWKKKPYRGFSATASANVGVGFGAVANLGSFMPSVGAGASASYSTRRLEVHRQVPMSVSLAPTTICDLDKGVALVDHVVSALALRLPVAEPAAAPDIGKGRSSGRGRRHHAPSMVRALDHHHHPALAVLTRFGLAECRHACAQAGAGMPYLATVRRMLGDGRIDPQALLRSTNARLAAFENAYLELMEDAHAAKEARRCGDRGELHRLLVKLGQRDWSGWNPIAHDTSVRRLEIFLGHTIAMYLVALTRLKYEATFARQRLASQSCLLTPTELQRVRTLCSETDRLLADIDREVAELRPPMREDMASGTSFFVMDTAAARRSVSTSANVSLSAGLGASVAALAGGAAFSTLRGPEVRIETSQTFTNVHEHPNQLRTGHFISLVLTIRGGVGANTLRAAAEHALDKARRKGKVDATVCESLKAKMRRDIDDLFSDKSGSLALLTRSSGLSLEFNYGSAPAMRGERPVPVLRYVKLLSQTTHDNSVRAPDLLAATGLPVQLAPGITNATTFTTVSGTRNGGNVRHLVLDYCGTDGIKALLKPQGDDAAFDAEAARAALLAPFNAGLREAWFHSETPVVAIVEKYLRHHAIVRAAATPDPEDEFAYIDMDGPVTRRLEQEEPMLRLTGAGSGRDIFEADRAIGRRTRLARSADDWRREAGVAPHRLQALRRQLAAMRTDEERVDFLTRDPQGLALLRKCIMILDAYAAWSVILRLAIGYEGRPNMASIDLLDLQQPDPRAAAIDARPGGFIHAPGTGKPPESEWL